MAHRVAELIEAGESDEQRRGEASDLVLRLWERRATWPQGWPPPAMARSIQWLEPTTRAADRSSATPWARRLHQVETSLRQELLLWLTLAYLEDPEAHAIDSSDPEVRPEDFPAEALSESERRILEILDRASRRVKEDYIHLLDEDLSAADRAEIARRDLSQLTEERLHLFEEAANEASSGPEAVDVDGAET